MLLICIVKAHLQKLQYEDLKRDIDPQIILQIHNMANRQATKLYDLQNVLNISVTCGHMLFS